MIVPHEYANRRIKQAKRKHKRDHTNKIVYILQPVRIRIYAIGNEHNQIDTHHDKVAEQVGHNHYRRQRTNRKVHFRYHINAFKHTV